MHLKAFLSLLSLASALFAGAASAEPIPIESLARMPAISSVSMSADGKQLVAQSTFFAVACAGYVVLTLMVWLNAYGKCPAPVLAWSLIVWAFVGLWLPAFSLMVTGTLPF